MSDRMGKGPFGKMRVSHKTLNLSLSRVARGLDKAAEEGWLLYSISQPIVQTWGEPYVFIVWHKGQFVQADA